ncbi:ferric uptake regulator, Fur family [Bacteroides coprosuis DSM 18011]|uniref:Ferric uptake regulation protein n=1 Tax=Bacteroides coprosuis DSM 18011 TaxID=679937 RepID=F3ZTE0_9BACE|nr:MULTISPECIES: Fur family transcriptional regulator [Bacteroides]EGJ71030.1 ferric uptake regulator, Fur family [Bacteroides coprosuis DSM 18011]HJD92717.1 transcriptional repressor [Bacteroides coprosuis]
MEALERLEKHEIKPSMQRISIMKYLIENRTHPSVDEIFTALSPAMPTLSKTTVYNTLKLFEEHNAVKMLTIDEKNSCFDIDTSPHAHFFCKECKKIEDLSDVLPNLKDNSFINGNMITETHFYYKGICKSCLKSHHVTKK